MMGGNKVTILETLCSPDSHESNTHVLVSRSQKKYV